jgi:DNA-binding PadR family transcriptional regulator
MERVTNKTAAVRAALFKAGEPLLFEELQPRVEENLKQIVGRSNFYVLLCMMKKDREVETTGRAKERKYALTAKGRAIHARSHQ